MSKMITLVFGLYQRPEDGRILGVQESHSHRAVPDMWGCPGGRVDEGEDPTEALTRESQEEIGVKVTVGELLVTISSVENQKALIYRVEEMEGEPQKKDVQGIGFFTPNEFRHLDLQPSFRTPEFLNLLKRPA